MTFRRQCMPALQPKRSLASIRERCFELKISPSSAAREQVEAHQPLPPLEFAVSKHKRPQQFLSAEAQRCPAEAGAPSGNDTASIHRASAVQSGVDRGRASATVRFFRSEPSSIRAGSGDGDIPNASAFSERPERIPPNRAKPENVREHAQWRLWRRPALSRPSAKPPKFATIETLRNSFTKETRTGDLRQVGEFCWSRDQDSTRIRKVHKMWESRKANW